MASAYATRGNEVVNELFQEDSSIMAAIETSEGDDDAGGNRFADMAALASLASMHDADSGSLSQLRAALKDDAALKKILKSPRLAEFVNGEPVLSPGQRLRLLTKTDSGSTGSLLGQRLLGPETPTPLMLTRVSKDVYPPITAVLTETLSPVLARVNPHQALKVTERLTTIQLVADSVQPDLEGMMEAVANSQTRQIETFMGSIERTIAAAAAGLKSIIGIEITDYSGKHLAKTDQRRETGLMFAEEFHNENIKAIGGLQSQRTSSNFNRTDENLRIHRERPMADGEVTVDVKPFSAHSIIPHFAANSAPLGEKQTHVEHHTTDSGAYASATGPAVCASSATVVEANFHSDGFEVEINVRP